MVLFQTMFSDIEILQNYWIGQMFQYGTSFILYIWYGVENYNLKHFFPKI